MKKNILRLFYIPIIFLTLFSFIYLGVMYFFIHKEINKEVSNIQKIVIKQKKAEIKKDIDNFKCLFSLIKNTIYNTSLEEMSQFLNFSIQHKKNLNNTLIILDVTNKKLNYSIEDNRYIILNYKKNKYLVFLKNRGKKVYLIGIKKSFIDNIVLNEIKIYLNKINQNRASYIAMGKINTFNPDKNGIFGYVYYMPNGLKSLEGKMLSINKPDVKGNYFRKKYLECLKKNPKGCFLEYYFKNPKTLAIEKKLSYISFIKDYNLDVLKGVYESQIENLIKIKGETYINEIFKIFLFSIIVFIVIYLIFIYLLYLGLSKIKKNLLDEYNELKEQLEGKYYYDNLTALPNRLKLDYKRINQLIIIDIKDFGILNELYGFELGDKVLIKFAKELKEKFENVYRYGNDEFILALENGVGDLISNVKSVLENVSKEFNLKIEINMGVSNIRPLLETAEMALYEAKRTNEFFVVYDDRLQEKEKKNYEKIQKLRDVLEKKNIIPYYHGIVDENGNIVKYEALMRIKIGDKIYAPDFFMDLIKQTKLYDGFSKIMIEKVFADLNALDKKVCINLSFEDIANRDIKLFILSLINENNAKKVIFEILESESIKDYDLVKSFIDKIKEKGAEIAIDDFGSGYSNFVNIMKLNPNVIKIDGSLIRAIKDEKNYKLVKLILSFAKEFNLEVVAEFVTDKEKFIKLKNIKIDTYQGFYFCKPEPLENIIKEDKISSKKGENEN